MHWTRKSARNILVTALCFALLLSLPIAGFAAGSDQLDALIRSADEAMKNKELEKAEDLHAQILKADPKNWRVMFAQARLKADLQKYKEAQALAKKILAIPVSNGRDVLVFYPNSSTGEAAELVDEIVLPPQRTKNNMRNYLDIKGNAPLPHYRLFFKEKGKMELVPQKLVRLEYQGVLVRTYHEVQEFDIMVDKVLVASAGNSGTVEMVDVPGGCFQMGNKEGTELEKPVHEVCLKSFKMDKYEVTQASYQNVMDDNPARFVGANRPAESLTWYEADRYCKKVNKRLPTEAEWEYAARGKTSTNFYWGDTIKGKEANFCDKNCTLNIRVAAIDDGYETTSPVGQFPANSLGLHDMAGNIAEWVNDWMAPNYYMYSPKDNPQGPRPLPHKVIRGGAWNTSANFMRSSSRTGFLPGMRHEGLGFRCVSQ